MAFFTRNETELIRAHRLDTTCYVLADQGMCLRYGAKEVDQVRGRRIVALTSADLPARLPNSWFLAVILCPGDTTGDLARWASNLSPADVARIIFYEAFEVDAEAEQTYGAWVSKNLPDPIRRRVDSLEELTKRLGGDLNRRILRDHQPAEPSR